MLCLLSQGTEPNNTAAIMDKEHTEYQIIQKYFPGLVEVPFYNE